MMDDVVMTTEVGVLVFQYVETVRACGDDFLYSVPVHDLYIHSRLHLEQKFVAGASSRISVATFFRSEHGELYSTLIENHGHSPRNFLRPFVKASGTTYPEENFRR